MADGSLSEMVKAAMAGATGAGAAPEPPQRAEALSSEELFKLADAVEHVSESLRPVESKRDALRRVVVGGVQEPGTGPGSLPLFEHDGKGGPPLKSTGGEGGTPKALGKETTLPTNAPGEKQASALYERNRRVAERLKKAAEVASGHEAQKSLVSSNAAATDATKKDVKAVPTKEVNELFRAQAMKDPALQQVFDKCREAGVKTAAAKEEVQKLASAQRLLGDLVRQVERHRGGRA